MTHYSGIPYTCNVINLSDENSIKLLLYLLTLIDFINYIYRYIHGP